MKTWVHMINIFLLVNEISEQAITPIFLNKTFCILKWYGFYVAVKIQHRMFLILQLFFGENPSTFGCLFILYITALGHTAPQPSTLAPASPGCSSSTPNVVFFAIVLTIVFAHAVFFLKGNKIKRFGRLAIFFCTLFGELWGGG